MYWVQAWPDQRSSSSSPPFCSGSVRSLWGAPSRTSPCSAPGLGDVPFTFQFYLVALRSDSATLCSLTLRPSYPLCLTKAMNCRWRHVLAKRKRGSQTCAALR